MTIRKNKSKTHVSQAGRKLASHRSYGYQPVKSLDASSSNLPKSGSSIISSQAKQDKTRKP